MTSALITGASAGLGRALALALARDGWTLTIDARHPEPLERTAAELAALTEVRALPGDVADPAHRAALVAAAAEHGPLDLLVNNASDLGGSPLPALRDLEPAAYERLWRVNVLAPQQLVRAALAALRPGAVVINVSSDAGAEHYETWGGYGSSKAALDHQTLTWAAEEPGFTWYAVDPGRHAHRHAPGRIPRRGHHRPARAGGRRPADRRPGHLRPAERALRRRRPARARPR